MKTKLCFTLVLCVACGDTNYITSDDDDSGNNIPGPTGSVSGGTGAADAPPGGGGGQGGDTGEGGFTTGGGDSSGGFGSTTTAGAGGAGGAGCDPPPGVFTNQTSDPCACHGIEHYGSPFCAGAVPTDMIPLCPSVTHCYGQPLALGGTCAPKSFPTCSGNGSNNTYNFWCCK